MQNVSKVGKLARYPYQPDNNSQIAKLNGIATVSQSIYTILSTPESTAFYQEDRGSLLQTLVYEQNDDILKAMLDQHIVDSIRKWDNRIIVTDIQYESINENLMNCKIIYTLKSTGQTESYVYPFNREIDR